MNEAFLPMTATQTISASTTSARVLVDNTGANGDHLMVLNESSAIAYVKGGDSSVTATIADYPVAPGKEIIRLPNQTTHVAAILKAGTGSVYVCKGQGI